MSPLPEQDLFYDYDRDFANRSPQLEAIKPKYAPEDSPGPLVRIDPSSDSADTEDSDGVRSSRKPKKRKGRTNPSFADGVLIRSLDSNQIELAAHAEKNPLESASQSEAEEEENEAVGQAGQQQMSRFSEVVQLQPTQVATKPKEIARAALSAISFDRDTEDDWPMIDPPASVAEEKLQHSSIAFGDTSAPRDQEQVKASISFRREDPPRKQLNTLPPPLTEVLRLNLNSNHEHQEDDEDSIIKSPALAKFAIPRNNAPPDSILPALQQKSPPRSSPAGSPDHRQTLPNLETAIGHFKDSSFTFASMSPIGRPSPGHLGPFASPASYSAMSPPPPPGPPSQYDWRTTTRDSKTSTSTSISTSTSSNYASFSATASTPASSTTMPSPAASHPSSLSTVPEQNGDRTRRDSFDDDEPRTECESHFEPPDDDDPSSPRFVAGAYKCTYHGCTAAPFQTQYLLNSHMNVHSTTRTHFCPVKGCTRGRGGQGFKRKNEMIRWVNCKEAASPTILMVTSRHGLVHTSPGYICPFCPDQQHKYPRPDNLQRHVRQHHMDRDRDDPVLRDVLNQRLEGGSRGGRRRMRL